MKPMDAHDRATAVATAVVDGISDERFGLPTPCSEWTVRGVLNHLVVGNLIVLAILAGRSHPDRDADHLGHRPKVTFATSNAQTRAALGAPGVLERTLVTPIGEAPCGVVVVMRACELLVHAWDLATATGQSTDLDPELADHLLAGVTTRLGDRPRRLTPFADPQPVPDDASAADRLAAYLGRSVAVR